MRKYSHVGLEKDLYYKPEAFIIALFVINRKKKQNIACSVVQDIPSKRHPPPNK